MTTTTDEAISWQTWRICWVIVFGAFASGLDASVVNIGLDTINRDLHSNLALTQWVASGYLLALALSLPLTGWLGRRFGAGRVWLAALAAFTVASGLCAIASNIGVLIAAGARWRSAHPRRLCLVSRSVRHGSVGSWRRWASR